MTIYQSIKAFEIRTSIASNFVFPTCPILSCFFFFGIDIYFLIPAVTAQIFIPTADLATPTGTQTDEANVEIETQLVTSINTSFS